MTFEFEKQQLQDEIAFQSQLAKEKDKFFIALSVGILVIALMAFLYWRYTQNLKLKKLENQMLSADIEHQKIDLTNFAVNISNNQEWAESLSERVEEIKRTEGEAQKLALKTLEQEVKNRIWVDKENENFYEKIILITMI